MAKLEISAFNHPRKPPPMLDFTRFEILTFDCYGTLIDWESGILAALHRVLSAHGKKSTTPLSSNSTEISSSSPNKFRARQVPALPQSPGVRSPPVRRRTRFRSHRRRSRLAPRLALHLETLARHRRRASSTQDALPSRHSLQRRRRSLRLNAPATRSRFRRSHHRPASPGLQAVAKIIRTSPKPHPRPRPSGPARRPKHLTTM